MATTSPHLEHTNRQPTIQGHADHIPAEDLVTDGKRQRRILIAMIVSLIAVIASVSGLNVAQQDLAIDLGASQGQLLWVINGYTIALAALLLPIGAVGDRWGRKHILLAGLTVFALANIGAAMSTTVEMLLVARVIAGVGAAMIMPVTLSIITSSFPEEDRARAIGIWAGFAGAGGILGLFVSSFMIDYFTWPWLFAMPTAFAVVGFGMTLRNRHQYPRGPQRALRHLRLDPVGDRHRHAGARYPRGSRSRMDQPARAGQPDHRRHRLRRVRLGRDPPRASPAGTRPVPGPDARRRLGEPVHRVRRDVRHLPGADAVPAGGARLLGPARHRPDCCRWPR